MCAGSSITMVATVRRTALASCVGVARLTAVPVDPQQPARRRVALVRVLRGDDQAGGRRPAGQGGDGEQPEGAGADDRHRVVGFGSGRRARRGRRTRSARSSPPPGHPAPRAPRAAGSGAPPSRSTTRHRRRSSSRSATPAPDVRGPGCRSCPRSPAAQGPHGGEMPRAAHPSTGSTTTRRPSGPSATTSWPGTNGNETIGSNHRLDRPSTVARSEPQMPASRGVSRTQSGAGSSGEARSSNVSGPTPAPAAGAPDRRPPGRRRTGRRHDRCSAPSSGTPGALDAAGRRRARGPMGRMR